MKRLGRWALRLMDRYPVSIPFVLVVLVVLVFSGTPAIALTMAVLVALCTHVLAGWME